jgi:general secretion pathway protein M
MNASLKAWWRSRTLREQRLLLVMATFAAILLAWLLIVRPLSDALSSARERHGEAVVALAQARAQAKLVTQLQGEATPRAAGPVDALLMRTANETGFKVARVDSAGSARATIAIEAARPQAFFQWVDRMENQEGLLVERLKATANSDQTLAIEATFRARAR